MYPNPRRAGETIDLIGVTLPGVPALVAGSNRHVAWAFTNSYGDWIDWVRVTLDPATRRATRTVGLQPLQMTNETIKVHGGADETLDVRDTEWGPIIADDADGTPLALAWTATAARRHRISTWPCSTSPKPSTKRSRRSNNAGMRRRTSSSATAPATSAGRSPGTSRVATAATIRCCRRTGASRHRLERLARRRTNIRTCRIRRRSASGPRTRARSTSRAPTSRTSATAASISARARGRSATTCKAKDHFAPDDCLAIQLDDRALLLKPTGTKCCVKTLTKAGDDAALADMKKYAADWNDRADPASVGYRLTRTFRTEVIDTILDGFAAAVRAKFADFKMPHLGQAEMPGRRDPAVATSGASAASGLRELGRPAAQMRRSASRRNSASCPADSPRARGARRTRRRIGHPLSGALPGMQLAARHAGRTAAR